MKIYFIALLTGVFVAIACLAVFNWWVNPYGVFSAPVIEGFNALKVDADTRGRLSKVYEVNRLQPDVVILGSSRSLNVPIEPLRNENNLVYNLALSAGTGYEMYRMFQHANAVHPLNKVVIGIDEYFSNVASPIFAEDRLRVDADNQPNNSWRMMIYRDYFSSLFSLDALRSSIRTVTKQPELSLDEYYFYDKKRRVVKAGGHHQMFLTDERHLILRSDRKNVKDCKYRQADAAAVQTAKSPYFDKMMQLAYQHDIQFYIFFSPLHARIYEIHCITGSMLAVENTKRAIVEIVEAVAERLGKAPYPVWDFTGYNSVTTESVPELGDTTTLMEWYWEGSHYTRSTGTLILNKMLEQDTNLADDFGVRINTSNIEQQLRAIHEQRKLYQITNSSDIEEVRNLIQ